MHGVGFVRPPSLRTVFLLLALVLISMAASAQTSPKAKNEMKSTDAQTQQPSNPDAGQKIYIDPVTKQIVQPTQEDIDALQNAGQAKKSLLRAAPLAVQPEEFETAEGAIGLVLPEDTMSYAVATKGADGKVKLDCVEGKDKAAASVNGAKPVPAKEALDEQ